MKWKPENIIDRAARLKAHDPEIFTFWVGQTYFYGIFLGIAFGASFLSLCVLIAA